MQTIHKQHIKFVIKDNSTAIESPKDLIVKQGLKDFNRQILCESGSRFSIIATDNDAVIGGVITEKCSDAFYVKFLWVHESYRKAGIATHLIYEKWFNPSASADRNF